MAAVLLFFVAFLGQAAFAEVGLCSWASTKSAGIVMIETPVANFEDCALAMRANLLMMRIDGVGEVMFEPENGRARRCEIRQNQLAVDQLDESEAMMINVEAVLHTKDESDEIRPHLENALSQQALVLRTAKKKIERSLAIFCGEVS